MTTEIDQYVQTCLRDYGMSPWRRAKMAVNAIEAFARAEVDLDDHTRLPVPLEWEHRVPTDNGAGVVHEFVGPVDYTIVLDPPIVAIPEVDYEITDDEPSTINYEPADPEAHDAIAAELMGGAFDALYEGDEDLAERKFSEYWSRKDH
jgi:hypothetical protein